MVFSRIGALITALLIIAIFTLGVIFAARAVGAAITHGPDTKIESGTIVKIVSRDAFVLRADDGTMQTFHCVQRCLQQGQDHMQRHLKEKAHTDIYYLRGNNGGLYAVDVD